MASEGKATSTVGHDTSEAILPRNIELERVQALAGFIRTDQIVQSSLEENPTTEKYKISLQLGYMEKDLGFDTLFENRVKEASDAISKYVNPDTQSKLLNDIIDIHLQNGNIKAAYDTTSVNDIFVAAQKLPDIYRSQMLANDHSWKDHAKITSQQLLTMRGTLVKSDPNFLHYNLALNKFIELYCEIGATSETINFLSAISDYDQKQRANITIAKGFYREGKLQEYNEYRKILTITLKDYTPDEKPDIQYQYVDMLIQTDNLEEALEQANNKGFKDTVEGIEKYIHVAEKYKLSKPDRSAGVIREVIKAIKLMPTRDINHEVYQHAVHLYMTLDKPKPEDNLLLTGTSDFKSSSCGVMQCYAGYEYAQAGHIEGAKLCAEKSARHNYTLINGEDKITIIKLYELYETLGNKEGAQQIWNRLEDDHRTEYVHKKFMSSSLLSEPEQLAKYLSELKHMAQDRSSTFNIMHHLAPYITEISLLLGDTKEAYSLFSKVPTYIDKIEIIKSLLQFHGKKLKQVFDTGVETIQFEGLRSQLMTHHGSLNRNLIRDIGMVIQNVETVQHIIDMLPSQSKLEAKFLMYREATQFKTEFAEIGKNAILEDTKNQLRKSLDAGQTGHISDLTQILVNLSSKEAGDVLLTHTRELYEKDFSTDPRLITHFTSALTELNTFRGNDLVFTIASDNRITPQVSKFLYDRLINNGYLSKDILDWLDEQNKKGVVAQRNEKLLYEAQQIESIKIVSRAGILPSHEVMTFLVNESWQDGEGADVIDLQVRIELVKTYLGETDKTTDSTELVKMLYSDRKIAMAYYIQHNREIRFDLVNNYSFEKFWDILGIIDSLEVHETPIDEFIQSLSHAGFTQEQIEPMITNLRNGHHPWFSAQESEIGESILLDVSNQQVYEQKMLQLQNAFGSEGLGTCLISPFLRKHLEDLIATKGNNFEQAQKLLIELNQSSGIANRAAVVLEIKNTFSEFLQPIYDELSISWNELRSKLSIAQVDIVDVLNNQTPAVSPESLIYAVEDRRHNLKSAKKELIAALQLENPQMRSISQEIRKKRKAAQVLRLGSLHNPELQPQIDVIEHEVESLEMQLVELGSASVVGRYENEAVEVRNKMLNDAKKEFETLSTKDTAPILVYMIAELIEHMPILESDSNVMKEVSSHLSDPMTAISQLRDVRNPRSSSEQLKNIQLAYVDKHKDLMRMVRFADSKICCFSSSNYDMRVAHNTENKFWVASINKDPLSFVFELQDPDTKNNTGFIFGSFGIDEDGYPAILLNGIYLSSGNTKASVNNILDSIEKNFATRIRAKTIAISNIYGGKMSQMPNGYSESDVVLRRLRALDDGRGNPETKIYDDLSQIINEWKTYGAQSDESLAHEGTVYHKIMY